MKLVVLFALFSLLFHGGIYPKASADTVTVDTTDDVINGDTSSITTLMSTPGADGISLREAIIATNNTSGADQINLAAETYLLSIFGIEDDALQGDFDIRDDLTIVGVSASATRIDGTALSRIFEVHNDTAITVTISNLKLEGATPLAGLVGAAIHIKGDVTVPDVTLSNVWLTNNSTGISADGGAIYNEGMLTVTDSLIDTNTGLNGGAIYNHANGDVTLINVTLSGNTAGLMNHGGGLYNDGIATLQNVTITANEANQGGGIYDTGPGAITSIINTIVAGNSAPTSPDVSGDLSSGGFNIFGDQSGGSGFDPSTLETDPLLGPLQNNGGPTFTHALLDGSPAIDAGTVAGAPLVDQRGVDRDARPDIGAYEEQVISALWLSTEDDVPSPSQVPGLDSWGQDEVLVFDEPDFNLEPGFTDGTLYPVFNLDPFAQDGDADVQGLHYVSQDISVGGNFFPAIDLFTGDLLLIVDANETFDGTGINLLSVTSHDVVVFRPDVAGDYSAGTFLLLLQDPSGDPLKSISLIENLTLVGDVTLGKGTFIFSQLNNDDDAIYHFDTDDVGTNTSGVVSVLLDGSAFGLDQPVAGLDLVEQGLTAGGTALQAGTLLVTLEQDDGSVGTANPISTTQQDIFYLTVAATSMGSGTSAADATLLLEGSDVGLNTDAEDLDALTLLATVVNNPPTALNSTVSAVEDTPYTFTVSDFNFSDLDGENLAQLRIKTVETAGDLELSGADVTAGQVISATDITAGDLKFTSDPNDNASHYATFEFYVHDGIEYSDNSYTMTIAVAEQADAPGVTSTTTEEDTQSSTGLVLSLNAADGEGVTHFKITDISGGTLYQNDGITAIHAGDFITFWEGYAGLKFTPAANSTASGSFSVQASTANHDIGLGVDSVTATITVIPVGDTPQAASIVTLEDTPSGPIVLARNMHDGPEVTHFRITNVAGGQLVHADGMTVVSHGDFITFSQGNSGLQFTPSQNSTAVGSFDVESSEDGLTVASQSGIATATISVIPVADTPSITHANTLEDTQTTSGLVISRHAADGPEVTHFNITNIAGGTLYQNDGTTIISTGDFITVAQGNAGLKFTPSLNVNASGSFDVQASTAGQDSGLGGGTVTATIGVKPVNDGPSSIIALANYAISENTPLTLHGTGLSVGDPDAGASTVRVTLSIGEGSLTVMAGSTGVTVSGSGSTSVAFEGTLTQINKLLAGHLGATLIYHSIAATDTVLTLHIDDLGASGAGGRLTATDTATLTIVTIAAENSRPTAIRVSHTTVDENTDTSSGYRIGTLITTDPDSADTSIYTIVGGADAAKFSIGGAVANELILTDGRLDHETTSSYEVMVRVTDSGGLTHDETFTIAVIDLAIVITAGQSFSVAETDAADALVGTVGTTGDHPTTFAITGGNLNNAFAIDASGTITVANSSALDFETTPSYTLTIEVSDGTSSVSETVTIMVTDVAETSSTGDSGLNPGDSEPSSDSPSAGGGAPIPDPTPDAEVHPPTSTSEDNTLPNPPPAEEVSPEPQVSNPQVSNLQTPRPQGSASRPTQLGTGENGFRPGRISPSGRNRERVNTPTPIPATSAQRADTVVVPNGVPPATDDPSRLILAAELLQEFDKMRTEIRTDASLRQAAIGLTVALTTGFSIGYVLWLIRGGLLLSSLLSSLPAWRFVDPLPVLAHLDARSKEDEADDDSLESVIRKGADMANSPCESTPWRSNT